MNHVNYVQRLPSLFRQYPKGSIDKVRRIGYVTLRRCCSYSQSSADVAFSGSEKVNAGNVTQTYE